ncbi:hypothetical protein ACS0TY_033520 [Phlomoides rotata]
MPPKRLEDSFALLDREIVLKFHDVTNCHNYFQEAHWRSGKSSHKDLCRQLETCGTESEFAASNSLWPEYEMTNEDEEMSNDNQSSSSLITRRLTDEVNFLYLDLLTKEVGHLSRKQYLGPLTKSSDTLAQPKQSLCGPCSVVGHRKSIFPSAFEFQILPQLLYFFNVKNDQDSLDWATIVVRLHVKEEVSNEIQLQLYRLYKIVTEGPCSAPQPSA